MRSGVAGALVGPALCLPCLAVLGVLAASVVGFAVIGAWFSENALVLGASTTVALFIGTVGALMYVRGRTGGTCEIDPTKEHVGMVPQGPRQSPAPKESITPGSKERVSR